MTRSARNRATSAARRIAASVPLSSLTAYFDGGAFTPDGARRFTARFADPDLLDEVHWSVCAEVLNTRAWRVSLTVVRSLMLVAGVYLLAMAAADPAPNRALSFGGGLLISTYVTTGHARRQQ